MKIRYLLVAEPHLHPNYGWITHTTIQNHAVPDADSPQGYALNTIKLHDTLVSSSSVIAKNISVLEIDPDGCLISIKPYHEWLDSWFGTYATS